MSDEFNDGFHTETDNIIESNNVESNNQTSFVLVRETETESASQSGATSESNVISENAATPETVMMQDSMATQDGAGTETGHHGRKKAKKEKREKRPHGFFFKAVRNTICAVLIGAIAGASFYATAYLGYINFPINQNGGVQQGITAQQISSVNTEKLTGTNSGSPAGNAAGTTDGTTYPYSANSAAGSIDVSAIVDAVRPSVVAISGTVTYTSSNFYFFYNGGSYSQEVPCSGSGIIIGTNDEELLIVTNAHVVEDVNNLQVEFCDGTFVDVAIKGIKSDSDLAVIAAKLSDISAETSASIAIAKLGDSSTAKVGEFVVALGNAEGRGISATYGIISATNKTLTVDNVSYDDLIQTDAAINPGNSGGALVNSRGEVIGINSVKMSDTSVEGMGYAIAVSSVSDIIDNLMTQVTRTEKYSDEERGYLGIRGVTVTSEFASVYGLPEGVLIQTVTENSAAEKAGLMPYDILTGFDGKVVDSWETLYNMMNYYQVGEEVEVVYYHLEGSEYKEITVTLTLSGRPDTDSSSGNNSKPRK